MLYKCVNKKIIISIESPKRCNRRLLGRVKGSANGHFHLEPPKSPIELLYSFRFFNYLPRFFLSPRQPERKCLINLQSFQCQSLNTSVIMALILKSTITRFFSILYIHFLILYKGCN